MKTFERAVYVTELAYGDQPFFLPPSTSIFQFRTGRRNVLWHKENLLNVGAMNIPKQFDKIAWIDPDIWFMSPSWFSDAENALDTWPVIQLFEDVIWTNKDGAAIWEKRSCMSAPVFDLETYHPGFAWAARRSLWEVAGGLCPYAIVGASDSLLAAACAGITAPEILCYPASDRWTMPLRSWIHENGGAGYITGKLVHEWHGEWAQRDYILRHQLLANLDVESLIQFRPDGIAEFSPNAPIDVIDNIRRYFEGRTEDG